MNKSVKIYGILLALLVAVIIYIDANKEVPVNWKPTYGLEDKIPLGLYVLNKEIHSYVAPNKVNYVYNTLYEFLDSKYDYDLEKYIYPDGSLFYINSNYTIDNESTLQLLDFVDEGNTVFISATEFPKNLLDTLNIEINTDFPDIDGLQLSIANTNIKSNKVKLTNGAGTTFFEKVDTTGTRILGYQETKNTKKVNFIRVPFGAGDFLLHTQPACLTNYYLLKKENVSYAEGVLSYIPEKNLYWLAKGQSPMDGTGNSKLGYFFSQPALKYAWLIFLLGLLFFIIFNAKRRQRVIPIIKPVTNTTVEFTKTIGNLYLQEGDHQNIITKKIIYFLERIRTEYHIDTGVLDENFIKKLQAKTGKSTEDITTLVQLINYHKNTYNQGLEEDLLKLNRAIEKVMH